MFGSGDYAMRVWLNPDKLAARNLTASDVVAAIREQNVQVAAGAIGQQPVSQPVNFELQINVKGRLVSDGGIRPASSSRPGPTAKRPCSKTWPASN